MYPSTLTLLLRGLRRRCPWCGSKRISRHVVSVELTCPDCGLFIERQPGSFIGGIGLNTVVSFIAVLATIAAGFIWVRAEGPVWRVLVPAVTVAAVVPLVFYARSRLTWVALELAIMPLTEEEQFRLNLNAGGDSGSD